MSDDYRFHLANWRERDKTIPCPRCGRSKGEYKEYVDAMGNPIDPINHLCGKCNSDKRCGYHVTPHEWQQQHGKVDTGKFVKREEKAKARLEIKKSIVAATIRRDAYPINRLVVWLRSLPWSSSQKQTLEHALQLYCVGTMRNGSTIFWQIDQDRKVRTGKKMMYRDNGKRLKDDEGRSIGFGFMHNIVPEAAEKIKAGTHMYVQCAFGLHLTKVFDTAEVHIVESEKTALIMTCYDHKPWHEHVWIAVGSMQQLSEQWLFGLKGRILVAYPDANAVEEWRNRVETLRKAGYNINLSTSWMSYYDVENDPKADIGDMALQMLMRTPEAIRDDMIKNNPTFGKLIEQLQLEIKR